MKSSLPLNRAGVYERNGSLWMRKAYMEGFHNQSITAVVRPGDRSNPSHYGFIPLSVDIPVRFINSLGASIPGTRADLLPDDGTTVKRIGCIVRRIGDLTPDDLSGCPLDCATKELVRHHIAITYNRPLPNLDEIVTIWQFDYLPNITSLKIGTGPNSSVLVVFAKESPKENSKWWNQFDTLIAPKELEPLAQQYKIAFIDIESLIDSGSIQKASELARNLSLLTTSDGRRLSNIANYEGFELWWIHYDDLMYKFCLPYTQYARLLDYLKGFSKTHLYKPPFVNLLQCFLDFHNRQYIVVDEFTKKISFGILLQVVISIPFLLWVKIRRPKLMLWIGDFFDPPRNYDFRMRFIYEELYDKKIRFVEFVRSMETSSVVLRHALKRKRPVIYSYAIIRLVYYFADMLNKKNTKELLNLEPPADADSGKRFWFAVAASYLDNYTGDVWAIKTLKAILKFIGIKASIIPTMATRNFHEVLACKLLGIKIVGIQHGLSPKYHAVSDFMPEFDGEKSMSVDKYGLWSEWWKDYYVKNSRIYKPEQLYVSGLMRPLEKQASDQSSNFTLGKQPTDNTGPVKVLFVAGQLADPKEVMPYLEELLRAENISVYMTFRPQRDDFGKYLVENYPEILKKIGKKKILSSNIHEAIAQCDIVVGVYSTAVLESLLKMKPFIFFHTDKWGDYYDMKSFDSPYKFFTEDPQELVDTVLKNREIPSEILKELQNRFFGDPYQNGSKWVVEQVEEFL